MTGGNSKKIKRKFKGKKESDIVNKRGGGVEKPIHERGTKKQ